MASFVTAAAVRRSIRETDGLDEVMTHASQHFDEDISDICCNELDIPGAKHVLIINDDERGEITDCMLAAIQPVPLSEKPNGWLSVRSQLPHRSGFDC
jgi:UDP-N-acetylglucosamine 2-epimerase